MINFKNKKVALLGWGVDNQDIHPWLKSQMARITIVDEKIDNKPFGDLTKFDVIVRSPGVYRYRPELLTAEKAGVEITSKTKIFFDVCPCRIVGVTGTKGKGTTSTLICEMLKSAGKEAYVAGNIGKGMFENLSKLNKESWMVLELSSFQLIDLHKSPHIAVVLMTTIDHQDWHTSVDEYWHAKANIVKHQKAGDFAVINKDYENSRKIGELAKGKKIWISRSNWTRPKRLRGEHNKENLIAAATVAKIIGIPEQVISRVALEFKGLEHRLEEVATSKGVTYYDDSISTVPETSIAALQSFPEPIVLIAGGSDKGADYSELGKEIIKRKNTIRTIILVGLMAERINMAIDKAGGGVRVIRGLKSMSEIVQEARKSAKQGDVVVMSPGAASFDMFKNYKDRGDQFKSEVLKHV